MILIASGSEVSLALDAHAALDARRHRQPRGLDAVVGAVRGAASTTYREAVLPPHVRARVSVEAASPFGWERHVGRDGAIIGVDRFGASAPGPVVMREYGFTAEHIVSTAKRLLASRA